MNDTNKSVWMTCPKCSVRFGLTKSLDDLRKRDHDTIWCPNGHTLNFPAPKKDDPEKLKQEIVTLKKENEELKVKYNQLLAKVDQLGIEV